MIYFLDISFDKLRISIIIFFDLNFTNPSHIQSLQVVDRCSETQLKKLKIVKLYFWAPSVNIFWDQLWLRHRSWSQKILQELSTAQEGHGKMVRAWHCVDVAVCRVVASPAWCGIFLEISFFSPFNLGTLFRCCVLGQGTSSSNASRDSGESEYR